MKLYFRTVLTTFAVGRYLTLINLPTTMTKHGSNAWNEFRSDTFTTPTQSMLQAITSATDGDSVYQEDETTNQFEQRMAELAGKEAAMFAVSGTMTNQIGIRVNLHQPPYSILCDFRGHVYCNEAAGLAMLSQAMVTPVNPANGIYLTLEDVIHSIIPGDNIHYAPTRLISLENTLGGSIMPIEEIERISKWAKNHGIKMHLDGARLWNASAATDISIAEYCSHFDTVSLCMSKGLGAPVGSVLVGNKQDIQKAFHFKKQLGGGIRQAGLLTAAANVSIDEVWPTMKKTHEKVRQVAEYFSSLGIKFSLPVETNFIFIDKERSRLNIEYFAEECAKNGINATSERVSFHHQITDEAIELLKKSLKSAVDRSSAMSDAHWHAYLSTGLSNSYYETKK